ncbi:MAG: hypothetical protein J0H25_18645, partial [Rhizobiales bacterium]|nr:hypothetical protein [Hyphomicrobiales bacterium]
MFLATFVIGALRGLVQGNSPWLISRSFLPYAIMFTSLPFLFSRSTLLHIPTALFAVFDIGVLQAGYQVYLFFLLNEGARSSTDILIHRITLYDARVTLPFVVAANAIALAHIGRKLATSIIFICFSALLLIASLMTLTRTLVIVCFVAIAVAAVALILSAIIGRLHQWNRYLRPISVTVPILLAAVTMSAVPSMSYILQAFEIRIAIEHPSDVPNRNRAELPDTGQSDAQSLAKNSNAQSPAKGSDAQSPAKGSDTQSPAKGSDTQ